MTFWSHLRNVNGSLTFRSVWNKGGLSDPTFCQFILLPRIELFYFRFLCWAFVFFLFCALVLIFDFDNIRCETFFVFFVSFVFVVYCLFKLLCLVLTLPSPPWRVDFDLLQTFRLASRYFDRNCIHGTSSTLSAGTGGELSYPLPYSLEDYTRCHVPKLGVRRFFHHVDWDYARYSRLHKRAREGFRWLFQAMATLGRMTGSDY